MAVTDTTKQAAGDEGGMGYLQSLPRRVVTIYLPLLVFVIVLLFPFYWMAITAVKPNEQMTNFNDFSPFWVVGPTLEHFRYLLFETSYPGWLWNTILISTASTVLSLLRRRLRRLCHRAAALLRLAPGRPGDLPRLSRAALDPVHPARGDGVQARPLRHALRADPHLSDLPRALLHLAADGLFPLHPLRARGMRADRRRQPLADPDQDHPAALGARA